MPHTFDIKKLTELYATQENPLHIFLLVDGAAHEGTILRQVYEYGSPLEHAPLYQGTAHEEDQLLGPHLIRVHENSSQLHWFMAKAADAGLLLFSDKGTDHLAAHLKPWLECILPDDSCKLFRFYDPLIFYYFWPSLTPSEQSLFFGPVLRAVCAKPEQEQGSTHEALCITRTREEVAQSAPPSRRPWFMSDATFAALSVPARYSLEILLAQEFDDMYPKFSRQLGKGNVTRFAGKIVEDSAVYGLRDMITLKTYMACMAQLGIGFVADPQYAVLQAEFYDAKNKTYSVHNLVTAVEAYNATTWTHNGLPYYAATQKIVGASYETLAQMNSSQEIVNLLHFIYPEKAKHVGAPGLGALIPIARDKCSQWGLPETPGIALYTALMFYMGAACDADPTRPWVRHFLEKKQAPEKKARALFAAAQRMAKSNLRLHRASPVYRSLQDLRVWLERVRAVRVADLPQAAAGKNIMRYLLDALPEIRKNRRVHRMVQREAFFSRRSHARLKRSPRVLALLILGGVIHRELAIPFAVDMEKIHHDIAGGNEFCILKTLEIQLHRAVDTVLHQVTQYTKENFV